MAEDGTDPAVIAAVARASGKPNVNERSALPDDIRESVAVSNIKCIAEQPCVLANLALANAVEGQQLTAAIARQGMYRAVESLTEPRTTTLLASIEGMLASGKQGAGVAAEPQPAAAT